MQRVQRLACIAHLDEPGDELEGARARAEAGDESWAQWVREFDEGYALILRLEVHAFFDGAAGRGSVSAGNRAVWVERERHPPLVAGQVQEAAAMEFDRLAEDLRDSGVEWVSAHDLARMHVEVELAPDLSALLDTNLPQPAGRRFGTYPLG